MPRTEEMQRFQVDSEGDRKQDRLTVTVPALLIGNELRKTGPVATKDSAFALKTLSPQIRRNGC
jgi:hypothetical protein